MVDAGLLIKYNTLTHYGIVIVIPSSTRISKPWAQQGTNRPQFGPLWYCVIPAKLLHNSDTVSVHFNHFYYMGICNKLSRHLCMLTYIYLNIDEY